MKHQCKPTSRITFVIPPHHLKDPMQARILIALKFQATLMKHLTTVQTWKTIKHMTSYNVKQ